MLTYSEWPMASQCSHELVKIQSIRFLLLSIIKSTKRQLKKTCISLEKRMSRKVASEHGDAPVLLSFSNAAAGVQDADDTATQSCGTGNPDWRVTIGSIDPPSTERHQAGSESLNPAALLPQSAHSLPVPLPTNHPHAARQRPPTTSCSRIAAHQSRAGLS